MSDRTYDFRVDRRNGVTNDNPSFSANFGRRSKVVYIDPFNEIELGATFAPRVVDVYTNDLTSMIDAIPDGLDRDTYARLILQRIRAAAAWRNNAILVLGAWGDLLGGQAEIL